MIVQADNIEYMASIATDSVDLVVTSPPYNLGKEYEGKLSLPSYLEIIEPVIEECVRITKPDGHLCWQVGHYVQAGEVVPLDIIFYPLFKMRGLKLRNRIVWTFGHGLHCKKRFSGRHETILWFSKSDQHTFNLDPVRVPSKYPQKRHFKGPKKGQLSGHPLGKNPSDVWDIPNVKHNHPEKTAHPCQFPILLAERLILALTNEGDRVFDPYAGSGTTIAAALKNGRFGFGCEIDAGYAEIAKMRIGALTPTPSNREGL